MAEVITRFKLETTQYDSKLRTAAKELSDFAKEAAKSGNEFSKFTKGNVDAARAFGSIGTSATNAKDKVKELVGAYNDMAKAYNNLTVEQQKSDFGKAMAESMDKLKVRIREAKQEMQQLAKTKMPDVGGGGLFGGGKLDGMLQVFGGNLMTKAAGFAMSAVNEMGQLVKQSIEVAKSAEGIRIAYDRLNKPGLMQQLKDETHGVVSELELMKAAVKFNDFKLPVEQLGTMLAFAQQKAKDTGQSVDYMVDSIVTGLGRKSLMILDNLGISASEVKEKMKETGDMTTAVAQIIEERMSAAGDYVETAADRAAQAQIDAITQKATTDKADSDYNAATPGYTLAQA
jgi:ribosome recycling factor